MQRFSAPYYRRNDLDRRLLARACRLFERALEDDRFLTRAELSTVLDRAGIAATGERLAFITMFAELEAVICSGPWRGRPTGA